MVDVHLMMLHEKNLSLSCSGSGEKDFFKVILHYFSPIDLWGRVILPGGS
jgi:hypothetical protein